MARRRKQRNSDSKLAQLIVLGTFLLSLAYTNNLEAAFCLGMTILVVGIVFFGLVVYFWRNKKNVGVGLSIRALAPHQRSKKLPSEAREQKFDHQLQKPKPPNSDRPLEWSLNLIRSLDWKRFEELSAGYFQAKGRKAKVTGLGADGGIDVLLYGEHHPEKILGVVQCKAWTQKPVGVREIRELLGVMTDVGCPLGVYIATSGYTGDAKAFAEGKHINLMDARQLLELIQKLPPDSQAELLRQTTSGDYTTPSCPSCDIKLVSKISRKGDRAGQSFWGCRNFPRCRYTMRHAKSA
jgi:restriction system protein